MNRSHYQVRFWCANFVLIFFTLRCVCAGVAPARAQTLTLLHSFFFTPSTMIARRPATIPFFPPIQASDGNFYGVVGGNGLGATELGTVKATSFTVRSRMQATAVVPAGVRAGAAAISIVTLGGTAASATKFAVN